MFTYVASHSRTLRFLKYTSAVFEFSSGPRLILRPFCLSKYKAGTIMTSTKQSVSATRGTDLAKPLEGPVSLLWAYQLRREHALLLSHVDSLAEAVRNNDAAAPINSLGLELKALGGSITTVEREVDSQRLDLQAIRGRVSGGDEALTEVQNRVFALEERHKRTIECLEAEQRNMVSPQLPKVKSQMVIQPQAHLSGNG